MTNPLKERPQFEELPKAATSPVIENGRYLPPPEDKDGKIYICNDQEILVLLHWGKSYVLSEIAGSVEEFCQHSDSHTIER